MPGLTGHLFVLSFRALCHSDFSEESEDSLVGLNGLLFLPAAGYRTGGDIKSVGAQTCAWSSVGASDIQAYRFYFDVDKSTIDGYHQRHRGYPLRLASVVSGLAVCFYRPVKKPRG